MHHDANQMESLRQSLSDGPCLFDRSDEGKLQVSGPEAARFLHNLCTNDIVGLKPGEGCLAYFCDRLAKVQGQARVYFEGETRYWLDVPAGTDEAMLKHLDKHLISEQVEFANVTGDYCQFHLVNIPAGEVLTSVLDIPVPTMNEYQVIAGLEHQWSVRRNDMLGTAGIDIVVPVSSREEILRRLGKAGIGQDRILSAEVFDMLRIEAVTPIYGRDIDEKRFVMELADATKAVSYAKGCYLGQEPIVMVRDRAGFVNRAMKLVKAQDRQPIPAKANLMKDGKLVGTTTESTAESLKYGTTIALAYIQRGHQEPGTALEIDGPAGKTIVEIAE